MIKNIVHHFKVSPMSKEDVMTLIVPVVLVTTLMMGLITFTLLMCNS